MLYSLPHEGTNPQSDRGLLAVISAGMWREQFQVTGDEQVTREHFEKLVLIEAVVDGLIGRFDFSKFGQMLSGYRTYPTTCRSVTTKGCSPQTGKPSFSGECTVCTGLDLCGSQCICTFTIPSVRSSGKVEKYRAHPCRTLRSV